MKSVSERLAEELAATEAQVRAAIQLLDNGATVPFIARYRKEATGGLDDTQLRTLEKRLAYLRELDERRAAILKSIDEQGKLTPELRDALLAADTHTRLEDLYLPYKPKRRTKGQIAREAGLEPLAQQLLADPALVPDGAALLFVDAEQGVADVRAALEGARYILIEQFAERAELIGQLRDILWDKGLLAAKLVEGKEQEGAKFSDYFDAAEAIKNVPSHRALAMLRGSAEGFLNLRLELEEDRGLERSDLGVCERAIAAHTGIRDQGRPADAWLKETVRWTWRVKLQTHLTLDLLGQLRERAEEEAIRVFATNLRDLLLAAPAGPRATIGLDPGLRTGVKVCVVDRTGKLLETATIYPHAPRNQWDESIAVLATLAQRHGAELVSIGNGTASRETDRLATDLIKRHPELHLTKVTVSEAGASVYSASELAAQEFPQVDVSLRGAVSIARRLQDPLAELVKIDPKSIGVGQYQHDVSQTKLARSLDSVVEDCVNAVGVDVNTASAPLLARVSGVGPSLAGSIVAYRDQHGAFCRRAHLREVPRLGPKAFEQAAGFLRIMNGDDPLDASAVHPEAYPVVERIIARTGRSVQQLIGDSAFLRTLAPRQFTDERFGEPTVRDILAELEKPGRDPRPEFKTAVFKEGVERLEDLQADMVLEGVVTNVTNFGAFVDIGVHQDGLVHISAMSEQFVRDPRTVVKAGDVVQVKVVSVDVARQRIALTMRLRDRSQDQRPQPPARAGQGPRPKPGRAPERLNSLAAALAKARLP